MLTAAQKQIGQEVKNNIYQDFARRHLSGNLMNTLEIVYGEDEVKVRIPAVRYDQKEWRKSNAIIPTPSEGSYAEQVDITGGYSRTHQNYADRAITAAITQVLGMQGNDTYDVEVY